MTFIVEISGPWQWRIGRYESEVMVRYWWLCFAVAKLKVPFKEYAVKSYRWESE